MGLSFAVLGGLAGRHLEPAVHLIMTISPTENTLFIAARA